MTFATFTPPMGASTSFSLGTTEDFAPSVLRNNYGDGYSQRTPDGLNTTLRKLSPRWENLTYDEASTMISFFVARRGVDPFYFQLPGAVTIRKWICTKWSRTYTGETTCGIQAQWEEVVDPDV